MPCKVFHYLQFGFIGFLWKNISLKAACKMLMKLTTKVNFTNIFWTVLLYESIFCSFSLLTVWLCRFFWWKKISLKAAHKILVKLTTEWRGCRSCRWQHCSLWWTLSKIWSRYDLIEFICIQVSFHMDPKIDLYNKFAYLYSRIDNN